MQFNNAQASALVDPPSYSGSKQAQRMCLVVQSDELDFAVLCTGVLINYRAKHEQDYDRAF